MNDLVTTFQFRQSYYWWNTCRINRLQLQPLLLFLMYVVILLIPEARVIAHQFLLNRETQFQVSLKWLFELR